MKRPRLILLISVLCLWLTAPVSGARAADDAMVGPVCIVDGDTVMFGGKRKHTQCEGGQAIDLWGVAAFKLKQQCRHPTGRGVLCGRFSAAMLAEQIKKAEVRCELKQPRPDGARTAECFVGAKNLNRHMVENGYALAYRSDTERYTAYEAKAKEAGKGMWVTRFAEPWTIKETPAKAK